MIKRSLSVVLVSVVAVTAIAQGQQPPPHPQGQAPSQYPMLDTIAAKIIHKYQTSTCVQLATEKSQPATGQKAAMEERAIELLKNDPKLRKAFLDKVASPIADKLLQCGMIP